MAALPYFKFYAADFIADVLHLSLDERGAYITLLAWSWKRGALPLERSARAHILGVSTRKLDALWESLGSHWTEEIDGYHNPRLEEERKKACERSAKATASALRSHSKVRRQS